MSFTSWAQNAEDVVLWRALGHRPPGIYVDVGAGHPLEDSVTRVFYEAGWRGVNIDPHPAMQALLRQHRPLDDNLAVAVSDIAGEATLYVAPAHLYGVTTLAAEHANRLAEHGDQWRSDGFTFEPVVVPTITLDEVLGRWAPGEVGFLKIDVEGWEAAALRGARLVDHRPAIVVVEACLPGRPVRDSAAWEHLVLGAGYRATLFDGLNLFFVHRSRPELVEPLGAPANVFDDWVPWRLR